MRKRRIDRQLALSPPIPSFDSAFNARITGDENGNRTAARDGADFVTVAREHRSAILWMTVLSVLPSWLPILGPLAAGFVGGEKAGKAGRAVLADVLPAVLLGLLAFALVAWKNMPVIGALPCEATTIVIFVHAGRCSSAQSSAERSAERAAVQKCISLSKGSANC